MHPTPRLLLAAACALMVLGTALPVRAESPDGWRGGNRWHQQDRSDGRWHPTERHAERGDFHRRGWGDHSWGERDWRPRGEDRGTGWYAPPPPRAYRAPGRP